MIFVLTNGDTYKRHFSETDTLYSQRQRINIVQLVSEKYNVLFVIILIRSVSKSECAFNSIATIHPDYIAACHRFACLRTCDIHLNGAGDAKLQIPISLRKYTTIPISCHRIPWCGLHFVNFPAHGALGERFCFQLLSHLDSPD